MHGENRVSNIKPQSHSATLVTGATGFIGRHLIPKLILDGKRVVVLARQRAGVPAQERIADLFGEARGRLEVLDGDLADALRLKSAFQRLRADIETVIHCAGETSFGTTTCPPTRAVQIDGPLALLDLLAERGLRRWSHVSTAFICGRRSGVIREHEGDVGQRFHNPYEQIKLQSESAMQLACRAHRVDYLVHRPSIVIASRGAARQAAACVP